MIRTDLTPIERPPVLPRSTHEALRLLWQLVRVPVYVMLRIARPVVRFGLGALGLLSFLLAFFYHLASSLPHPPFLPLLGFSLLCGLSLLVYEGVLRVFS